MHLEVIRAVADWLADGTYGVNAKIDTLDLDGSDVAPTDVADILDETRDGIAALRNLPDDTTVPVLCVFMPSDAQFSAVNQGKQDADTFPVWIAYLDRDTAAADAIRDASYVLRAVRKSLNEFHKGTAGAIAARLRNGIEIRNGNIRMSLIRPSTELGATAIVMAVQVLYAVRDTDP